MNKIYKVIWSKAKHTYVVASEIAKGHTKGETTGKGLKKLAAAMLVVAALLSPSFAWAADPIVTVTDKNGVEQTVYTETGANETFATINNLSTVSTEVQTQATEINTNTTNINGLTTRVNALESSKTDTALHISSSGDLIVGTKENQTVKDMEIRGKLTSGSISTGGITSTGDVTVAGKMAADGVTDETTKDGTYIKQNNTVGNNLVSLDTQVKANADAIAEKVNAADVYTKDETDQKVDAANTYTYRKVATEEKAREAADKALDDRITNVKEYLEKQTSDNYVSKADAAVQDGAIVKAANTIGENVTNLDAALAKETAARLGADAAQDKVIKQVNDNLVASVNTINKNVADGFTALNQADANEAAAREAKDNELNERITNEANAIHETTNKLQDDLNTETTAREAADTALDTRITNVKEYLEKQTSDKYVSKTDAAVQDGAIVKAAKTIGENVTNLDAALTKETAARIGADKAQDKVIEQVNQNMVDGFNTINKNMSDGFTALSQADANELAGRMAADTKLVEATNGGLSLDNDNVLQKTKTEISSTGEVTTSKDAATTLILNKGAANRVKIDSEGVTVGTSSTQMDAEGFTAGGHDYDAAGAALMSDGRIKGANGDFTVDENGNVTSKATITGETVTDGKGASMSNGTVTGKTLTDGIATITNGNINTSGTITGGTVTSTGNISALGDIHAGGAITGASASIQGALTAGSATITGDLTAGGAIQGKSISDGTATMQNGNITGVKNLSAETITTSGDVTIGGDLTVKGKLNVDEIDLTKNGIVGDNNVTASTKVAAGEITSYKKATSTKDGSEKESAIDYDENGTSTWAKATDADGNWKKSTLTVEGSDVTSKVTDSDKNSNISTQTASESNSTITGTADGKNYKSYITQNLKNILQGIKEGTNESIVDQTETGIKSTATDGKNTASTNLSNNGFNTYATDGTNETYTKQTAADITNTAKNGTIANEAKDITNHASENMTNTVGKDLTTTVGGEMKTTVTGKVTEDYKSDLDTKVGGNETHYVAGSQTNTVSGDRTVNVKGTETENFNALETNVKTDQKTSVGGNQTNIVGGDQQNTVSGSKTETVKGSVTEKYGSQATTVDGDQSTNVGGNQSNVVTGNQTNTISGSKTETVKGSVTEKYGSQATTVDGDQSTNIGGNQTTVVAKDQTNTVSGNKTETVKGAVNETYGSQTTKVNGDQSTTVTGKQTNSITGDQVNTIGGNQTTTVTGKVTEDYKSDLDTKVGGNQTTTVTGDSSLSAKNITNTASEKIANQIGDGSAVKSEMTADGITNTAEGGTIYNKSKDILNEASGDILNFADGEIGNSATKITNLTGDNTVTSDTNGTTFENKAHSTAVKEGTITKTTISGNTLETGKATMDYAEVMKDLGVRGNAAVDGNTILGKEGAETTLTVNSKSTFKDTVKMEKTLEVDGTSTFNDKVTVTKGGLDVTGGTTTDTLHVTSTSTFDGTATFKDIVTMEKDLSVGGNATVAGNVTAKSYKVGDKTYIDENGINANSHKITNVAAGELSANSMDAVNGSQLYETNTRVSGLETRMGTVETKVDKLDGKIDKVGANAAAMANLHPLEFDEDSKWNIAAAVGSSGSETASAVGVFYRPNENVMVNASAAMGTGENMFGGGVSLRLGHGGNKAKEAQMKAAAAENKELRAKVDDLTARMDALLSVLNPNMSKDFPDVPENHWAYEAVSRLAGNGIVEGYEDGKYHGERQMTRYEMAEIIYNALSKGAKAEKKLVEEFRPELQAMAAQKKA